MARVPDLDAAEAELRWVLESGPADEVEAVARLRLARVLSAAGEYDAAIRKGIRIAKKQATIELLNMPIAAPEAN